MEQKRKRNNISMRLLLARRVPLLVELMLVMMQCDCQYCCEKQHDSFCLHHQHLRIVSCCNDMQFCLCAANGMPFYNSASLICSHDASLPLRHCMLVDLHLQGGCGNSEGRERHTTLHVQTTQSQNTAKRQRCTQRC